MTWILVLTLLGPSSQSGHAIAAIPGFQSEASCLAAGSAWLSHIRGGLNFFAPAPSALCVRQA